MRYILDSYGYVEEVTFGGYIICNNESCTEYTGKIPSGYDSLEEWNDNANIRAYKVVDGNLVYDADKDNELRALFEREAEENRHVTNKELNLKLSNLNIESSNQEELGGILPIRSESGEVITLFDSSSYPMTYIGIGCNEAIEDDLKLYISTSNMLPNNALSGASNGITYLINEDKSIRLIGSSEDFILNISGSNINTEPLFILKAGESYYLDEIASNVNLNLYSNDGTDRILFYTGTGKTTITPDVDMAITQAEITCTGEINETIYLMLSAGSIDRDYEPCVYNIVPIDLNRHTANKNSYIEIEDEVIILDDGAVNVMDMPSTFFEYTTIYANKNVTLDIDYKKSGFDYVTRKGSGRLKVRNTADGCGSVRLLRIRNIEAGTIYTLRTSDNGDQEELYTIDLTTFTGTVEVIIEEGKTYVYEDADLIGTLNNIYLRTYSPTTYIEILEADCNFVCEYMLASDFSIYCTRVEKDASIQMLDDKITLEVTRASAMEGELSGRITVEADKIEQIVESVGSDGSVTPASIVAAINEDGSVILLRADKVDMTGVVFPTIQNAAGDCQITTLFNNDFGDGIEYNAAAMHVFNGSVIFNPNLNMYGFMIRNTSGEEIFRTGDNFINVGKEGLSVRLRGNITVNGEPIGGTPDNANDHIHDDLYYTEAEIDAKLGDVESILNLLNGTGELPEIHNHNERYYQNVEIDLMLADAEDVLMRLNSGAGIWEIESEVM